MSTYKATHFGTGFLSHSHILALENGRVHCGAQGRAQRNVRLRIINGEAIHKKNSHTPEKQKGEVIHKSFCEGQKIRKNVPQKRV